MQQGVKTKNNEPRIVMGVKTIIEWGRNQVF